MNTTLYIAGFLSISGGALLAIFNILKEWIEKRIKNTKTLKKVKISVTIFSILLIIIGGFIAINDLKDRNENAQYDGIFVTPKEILIPIKAGREIPIVITNNFQFPVFMIGLEFRVLEGDFNIDFWNNFTTQPLLGGGFCGPKHVSCQIPGILAKSSVSYLLTINTKDFKKETKIEVSVTSYTKQPVPNFWENNQKELPKTIKVPEGFIPEIIHIDKK